MTTDGNIVEFDNIPDSNIVQRDLPVVRFVDSSTHRLRGSGCRTFKLRCEKDIIHLAVQLTAEPKKSKKRKKTTTVYTVLSKNKAKITVPVRSGHVSMLSSPLEIGTSGMNKLFLSVRVKPSGSFIRSQEVAVSLYSGNGTDKSK